MERLKPQASLQVDRNPPSSCDHAPPSATQDPQSCPNPSKEVPPCPSPPPVLHLHDVPKNHPILTRRLFRPLVFSTNYQNCQEPNKYPKKTKGKQCLQASTRKSFPHVHETFKGEPHC